jgi:hypothetical protein
MKRKTRSSSREKFAMVGNAIIGGAHQPSIGLPKKQKFTNAPKSDAVDNFRNLMSLPKIMLGKAFGISDKDIETIEKRHSRKKLEKKIKDTEDIPPKVIKSSYPFKGKTPELDKRSYPLKKNGGK